MARFCTGLILWILGNFSLVGMECDDSENEWTQRLVETGEVIERHVNLQIQICRVIDARYIVDCTFQRLGQQIRDSGFSPLKLAPLCRVEIWLQKKFRNSPHKLIDIPWAKSRYRLNKTGLHRIGRVPAISHLLTAGVEHSIVGTVRMKGVLIGIDKWAHFFTTGYHLWSIKKLREDSKLRKKVSQFLEGDGLSQKERKNIKPIIKSMPDYKVFGQTIYGVLGSWASGIISRADMNANELGFQFYRALAKDPQGYVFDLDDWDLTKMNEVIVPSKYVDGFKMKD